MKFLFEVSPTPIYQRIVDGFSAALRHLGHEVIHIRHTDFSELVDYLKAIQESHVDCCVITNSASPLSEYVQESGRFLFEFVESKIVFIHHDDIGGHLPGLVAIKARLEAFLRIKDRSSHFCVEHYNYLDLRALGLDSVYTLYHASEFAKGQPDVTKKYNVSFVGHILPSTDCRFSDPAFSHFQNADFWGRLVQTDRKIECSATDFANRQLPNNAYELEWLAVKHLYVGLLHTASQPYRGGIIERIYDTQIDIIGGDPGYMIGLPGDRRVEKSGLGYHPPTSDYSQVPAIFAASRINLNITSLQFDHAVINRVMDVASCGEFLLTDWKSDLCRLTSVHGEISYRSIDELNEKIEYYLTHERERLEVAGQLHQDITAKCSYTAIVNDILCKMDTKGSVAAPLRLDIGCGPRKKEGFTGVDIDASWPGVDIEADLTRRLPFADSSVDEIRAHDVIEHLPDRIHTMNELWRVCKHGAMVDLRVPSTDGRGAFQDPTHVSFWNVNSFKYYSSEYPAYLELCRSYGFVGEFKIERYNEERTEDGVVHVNIGLSVLKK